jgi:hypothetical protein
VTDIRTPEQAKLVWHPRGIGIECSGDVGKHALEFAMDQVPWIASFGYFFAYDEKHFEAAKAILAGKGIVIVDDRDSDA